MFRKMITAGLAVAMLAVAASSASADVPRCESPVTTAATATFSATTPYGEPGNWARFWTRDYTVTVQPDGTFAGTGKVYRDGGEFFADETITGKFGANNTVTFTATYASFPKPDGSGIENGFSYTMTNAPMDGVTATSPSAPTPSEIGFDMVTKLTTPQMVAATSTDMNHGEYVSSMGGGKAAAQACKGMPLNSKQGK